MTSDSQRLHLSVPDSHGVLCEWQNFLHCFLPPEGSKEAECTGLGVVWKGQGTRASERSRHPVSRALTALIN